MASEAVIAELTQVIQDCLAAKMQAGFDANATLTIDIARQVATEIEARAKDYTDEEIAKLRDLIGGDVDLGPFTEFMNTVKTLMDGDEETEGYQVFNTLITDTATNKQTLIDHSTSIQLITDTLTTMQTTLADHTSRIEALEAIDHSHTDCEECHDELLNIVKDAQAAACAASTTATATYITGQSAALKASFANELDPISLTASITVNASDKLEVTGTYVGRRVANIGILFSDGSAISAGIADGTLSGTSVANQDLLSGTVTLTAKDSSGAAVGTPVSLVHVVETGAGDGGQGDGAVL